MRSAAARRTSRGRERRRAKPDKPDKPGQKAKGKEICSLGHVATSVEMAMATDEANALEPPVHAEVLYPRGCRFGDKCRGHHYQPK